jgi:hypothetical protein
MPAFPSIEFFEALKNRLNSNGERMRRLGTADITLVIKINHAICYEITFAGYHCTRVRELTSVDRAGGDAVILEGPYDAWREMIENIQRNGQADLDHSLNSLTLMDTPLRVYSVNQLDTDLFYRYQQTLQEFFDGAAEVGSGAEAAPLS